MDLAADTIDVWVADLGQVGGDPPRSRWVLRALLGRYLSRAPQELALEHGAHGKPRLAGEQGVHFNLSHSGTLALYAFATAGPVGIDVERVLARRAGTELHLARRVFGAAAAQRLQELEGEARTRELLRLWVRHEAALKCRGVGLGGAPAPAPDLWIAELDLGTEAVAAVAAEHEPRRVRLREWSEAPAQPS